MEGIQVWSLSDHRSIESLYDLSAVATRIAQGKEIIFFQISQIIV